MSQIRTPKKLIEVALPLDDINAASAREKSIRHGHPSTLHLWWARRPLAAARAVIFAQMVNDPGGERGYYAGKTRAQADAEREELFQILRDLVKWENTNNEEVLARARAAIAKSWRETCELNKGKPGFDPEQLPAFHDPFAGGGALPLEAQRLGLESHASDLNPVAVTINKAMIEIPPRFAGRAPVGPAIEAERGTKKATKDAFDDWSGARGLAEDVRRYGAWMREQAQQRMGHLYPKVKITPEMLAASACQVSARGQKDHQNAGLTGLQAGQELTVIAWLWARTVKSPNPAFSHVEVPLASTFVLSKMKGNEAWVQPVVEGDSYRFEVRTGTPPMEAKDGTKISRGAFRCLFSGVPIKYEYIDAEANAGRMGARLMAIVAEGARGRIYLSPIDTHAEVAATAQPTWKPETACRGTFASNAQGRIYGFKVFGDYFTPRQLVALTTFSDLVPEAIARIRADALAAGMADDDRGLDAGGNGATAYAEGVGVYLGFIASSLTDRMSSICSWDAGGATWGTKMRNTFARQAIPMSWDFAEVNPFSGQSGSWDNSLDYSSKGVSVTMPGAIGTAAQADAQSQTISAHKVISTDPPYYDNIGYADLSDFFYVWLRRSLRPIFPQLYATLAVPKAEELIATPYRHGSKQAAEVFFLDGMTAAMHNLAAQAHPAFPVTIYYAFKQSDTSEGDGTHSTGWETFLEAVLRAGFTLTGTWPMRTELGNRMIGSGTNALASSIVLVCRPRDAAADTISRREFQRQLREHLPEALETMIGGTSGQSPIAPVDLAQAAIGPGMAIYSQYAAVLNQDGTPMRVHDALVLINREITDYLTPDAGSFDADTLFANSWFEQYGWAEGPFGEADVLARGKGTSVAGVAEAGVVQSGAGKVRLLRWADYPTGWNPATDHRAPVWEATHHLIRALNTQGEAAAGALLAAMPDKAEPVRQLAYHLYTLCERKKWAEDARAYNELITAWHAVLEASREEGPRGEQLGFEA